MKFLILKPSSLGDVVHALPILRLIKAHLPDSQVHWWLATDWRSLLEGDPQLSGLHLFPRKNLRSFRSWIDIARSVAAMRRERFDWVIDLQGLARSGFVGWLANGAVTVGLDSYREGARGLYDITVERPKPGAHAMDWYLKVLDLLEVPVHQSFDWLPERPAVIERLRSRWRPETGEWIAICPGARWQNKRWPVEGFCQLVRRLADADENRRFVMLGSSEDRSLGREISRQQPGRCLDLTGRTSIWEMVEWIRLSRLMVTNDTGPMHVGAALRKPVVSIFGPTNPLRTGPFGQLHLALQDRSLQCVPCMKAVCSHPVPLACLKNITPDQVATEVERRLSEPSG